MRKSKEEAAETRRRIVTAAAGEFREHGIVATGLADVMQAAGLTHGGFYKHFESKDQVVAEACAEAVRVLMKKLEAAPSKGSALGSYLSTRHRDDPATGCPLAALGSELARSDEKTRAAATEGFLRLVNVLAGKSGRLSPEVARRRALVAVSTMIVAAATRARRRASAVPAFPARMSTSLTKPAVAASRAFLSDRESSLPIAASGQPEAGLSRWRVERYAATAALMVG
jgi:TetR/AcrR family transcriptional regulator, transcriptional repressor for nem operon